MTKPKIVFSDFDGTLTYKHNLGPIFFEIMDLCHSNNAEFIIVSGRSVSWGHFLLTHFPINHVIMEGGGAIVSMDEDRLMSLEALIPFEQINELVEKTEGLLTELPDCPLSADSFGRMTDQAVELRELVGRDDLKQQVISWLEANELNFSVSNVHINFWLGNISKYIAIEHYLNSRMDVVAPKDCIFFGDAANDESVFEKLENSVGVSNISKCIDHLKYKPKIVLKGDENTGPFGVLNHLKEIFST